MKNQWLYNMMYDSGDVFLPKKIKQMLEIDLVGSSKKTFYKLQIGDIKDTEANIKKLKKLVPKYKNTKIEDGIREFVDWYKSYY